MMFPRFVLANSEETYQGQLSLGRNDLVGAVKHFLNAANKGDAVAQNWLGSMYASGKGVSKDEAEALKWYRKAADQDFEEAQITLGICYQQGSMGVQKDHEEAVKWFEKAKAQGSVEALQYLAMYGLSEKEKLKDEGDAKQFQEAADKGDPSAQNNLGMLYRDGRIKRDDKKMFDLFRSAAEKGNSDAQSNLGSLYIRGVPMVGVKQDADEAMKWFVKSADQDNPKGMNGLTYMYSGGLGVKKINYDKVIKWARKSAELGDPDGEFMLGNFYMTGQGVKVDYEEAKKWFRKSSAQGNVAAKGYLKTYLHEDPNK